MKTIIFLFFAFNLKVFTESPALIIHMEDGTTRELNLEEVNLSLPVNSSNNYIEIWTKSIGLERLRANYNCMRFSGLQSKNPKLIYYEGYYDNVYYNISDIDSIRFGQNNEINSIKYNKAEITISGLKREYSGLRKHSDQMGGSSSTFSEINGNDINHIFQNYGKGSDLYSVGCSSCSQKVIIDCFNFCSSGSSQVYDNYGMKLTCGYNEIKFYLDTLNQVIDSIIFISSSGKKYSANSGHAGSSSHEYQIFNIHYPIPFTITAENILSATISIQNLTEYISLKESYSSNWHFATSNDDEDKNIEKYSISDTAKITIKIY